MPYCIQEEEELELRNIAVVNLLSVVCDTGLQPLLPYSDVKGGSLDIEGLHSLFFEGVSHYEYENCITIDYQ